MATTTQREKPSGIIEPEVFLANHRRISDSLLSFEEFKASGKARVASAKAAGVNIQAYKLVRKLARMERRDAEQLIRDTLLYAKLLELGLGDQLDLFTGQEHNVVAGLTASVVAEHKGWEAERQGYENGKFSDPSDNCPHDPGTELHSRYMTGWHAGNAYRQEAEARGEKIIKPRKGGGSNPEDGGDDPEDQIDPEGQGTD